MEGELGLIISTATPQTFQFPPGFRFHPSDEELIVHYLRNKVNSRPLPASVAADIDLYKYNPWQLPSLSTAKAFSGEGEWYFFSPRDRKYPKGERPNRAAGMGKATKCLGYWKATGIDQPICSSSGSKKMIGVKKSLVFYAGRPPKGEKTDWLMNEYRLLDSSTKTPKLKGSMRLDDWVLCRIRCKRNMPRNTGETQDKHRTELLTYQPNAEKTKLTSANHDMTNDYMSKDTMLLAWILSDQFMPPAYTLPSPNFEGTKDGNNLNFNPVNSHMISPPIHSNFSLLTGKNSNEQDGDSPCSMTLAEANICGYNQNQSRYDILNANYPMDSIDKSQDLNELAITGRFLQ